jgi:hypothetical protein
LKIFFAWVLSAASCFIVPDAAGAFCCFAAVWANAVAVVDKVSAVNATRLTIFAQSHFASANSTLKKLPNKTFGKHQLNKNT